MFRWGLCALILVIHCNFGWSLRILCLPAFDTGSHIGSMMPFFQRLASAGHEVYVLDLCHPKPKHKFPNLHTITAHLPTEESDDFGKQQWREEYSAHQYLQSHIDENTEFGRLIDLHSETLNTLFTDDWDLMIVDDIFSPHAFSLAMRIHREHRVPYAFLSTSGKMLDMESSTQSVAAKKIRLLFGVMLSGFVLLGIFGFCDGLRILCLPAHDSGSHLISMTPFMKRLADGGHDVFVLNPVSPKSLNGPPTLHTLNFYTPINETANRDWLDSTTADAFMSLYAVLDQRFGNMINLHNDALDKVMSDKWDLVVGDEIMTPYAYAMMIRMYKEYKVPYLMFSTSGQLTAFCAEPRSLSRNPVIKSYMFPKAPISSDEYFRPSSFWYRLESFTDTFYELLGFNLVVQKYYMPNIGRFGVKDFTWSKLYADSAVTFADALDRLGWPIAEGTDLVNTGAYCKDGEVLTGELKEFVEDPKSKGTIYVAFGTYARWQFAPEYVINAFANGLQRFPNYRVILSYNGDRSLMPNLPFIKIVEWAPQTAILNHPKTKVFISHGGLKSLKESLCSTTPLIVMPLFAEQSHNAHMFLSLKLGRTLNKFTVNEHILANEINEILQNEEYQRRAERTRAIMLDRPIAALDAALFYTERVARAPRHKISFQRRGIHLSWCEHLYLEYIIALLSIVCILK